MAMDGEVSQLLLPNMMLLAGGGPMGDPFDLPSLMLPAAAAVREKERGTIEQLAVSPLSPTQILLPKVLAMMGGVATALHVFSSSGLGLFIATLSRNLGQVVMLVLLIMMPMLLLSGAWTPPEAMPTLLREAMHLSPLFYLTEMSYAILLKGAGMETLWKQMLRLALLGRVVFAFGVWRFRRQFG